MIISKTFKNPLAFVVITAIFATTSSASHARDQRKTIRDHGNAVVLNVRDHRKTKTQIRDHRQQRKNETIKSKRGATFLPETGKYSCFRGIKKLNRFGFRVRSSTCGRLFHRYLAKKRGKFYSASMSSYTGKLKIVPVRH